MVKKIIVTALVLAGVACIGNMRSDIKEKKENLNNDFKVVNTYTEPSPENNIYVDDGDTLIEFSNGSFAVINEEKNIYTFTPAELGDWDYEVENIKQLKNLITTYYKIKTEGQY